MQIKDVSLPDVYQRESMDFRFFRDWFANCLERVRYDHENAEDIYDPLRCPKDLLWALADTMGYKFDDRLPASFNRLVLLYFMSMIRNRGSKDGITLAAETNLGQFKILMEAGGWLDENNEYHVGKPILYDRLEDTSIPVNSVWVQPYTDAGYIDVVYFSSEIPQDACIEYVRPAGMYMFQHAGVRMDARTKILVDARLTNQNDIGLSNNFGPTHVGRYTRKDYSSLQRSADWSQADVTHSRDGVWNSNSDVEGIDPNINPGYRSVYSLQLANNEQVVKALLDPIFSLGWGPQSVEISYPDDYLTPLYADRAIGQEEKPATKAYNLRYDKSYDESIRYDKSLYPNKTEDGYYDSSVPPEEDGLEPNAYVLESDRTTSIIRPRPAVNPIMASVGDAISMDKHNTEYIMNDESGKPVIKKSEDM